MERSAEEIKQEEETANRITVKLAEFFTLSKKEIKSENITKLL